MVPQSMAQKSAIDDVGLLKEERIKLQNGNLKLEKYKKKLEIMLLEDQLGLPTRVNPNDDESDLLPARALPAPYNDTQNDSFEEVVAHSECNVIVEPIGY